MAAGRYALIIANAVYEDASLARLRAPSHDAEALRRVLEDESIGGFDVRVVADAGMRDVQLAVVEFFTTRRSGDLALLHFSGHGLKDPRGDLYFATRDTELHHLRATGVASTFVNLQISDCAARRVVVMLDCCYSGAFAKGALSRADRSVNLAEEFRPAEEERGKGRVVLTASSSTQYAFDGDELSEADDSPSVFTTALVEGLGTGAADVGEDGEISVDDLYEYVYDQVRRRTPYQVPQKHSFAIEGELVIAHSVRPLELPHDLRANLESASVGARLEAIGELGRWLASPKPARRSAARTELQLRQQNDDSLRVRQQAEAVLAGATAEVGSIGDPPVSKPGSRSSPATTDSSPKAATVGSPQPVPPTHQPPEPAKTTKAQAESGPPLTAPVPSDEAHPPATVDAPAHIDATAEPVTATAASDPDATPAQPVPGRPGSREASDDGVGAGTGTTKDRNIPAPSPPLRRNGTGTGRRRQIALTIAAIIALGAVMGSLLLALQDRSPSGGSAAGGGQVNQGASFPAGSTMANLKEAGKVRVGTKFDQPLFGFKNLEGVPEGFDVEIAKIIAGEMGIQASNIEWVETVSANREPYIQQGKVDYVVATYTINDNRKQAVDFAGPYYEAGQDIMVAKGNPLGIKDPDDLAGKRVCSVTGSTPAENIRTNYPKAKLTEFDLYSKCAEALKTGQVEAVTTDNVILLGLISQDPEAFELVGKQFTEEPYGVGVKKGDTQFRNFINDVLEKAYQDGRWLAAWNATAGKVTANKPTPPPVDRY
jgi:glutamate transport system substrate-binding protein